MIVPNVSCLKSGNLYQLRLDVLYKIAVTYRDTFRFIGLGNIFISKSDEGYLTEDYKILDLTDL